MSEQKDPCRIGPKSLATDHHRSSSHAQSHNDHDPDDHDEHIDERWLVSYADMMTLLFGLFVLLFSMSTLDPKTAEQIKHAAETHFQNTSETATPTPDFKALQDESAALKTQVEQLESQLSQLGGQLEQSKKTIDDQNAKITETTQTLDQQRKTIEELRDKNQILETAQRQLEDEKSKRLQQELASAKSANDKVSLVEELKKLKDSVAVKDRELGAKEKEIRDLQAQIDLAQKTKKNQRDVASLEANQDKLAKEAEALKEKNEKLKVDNSSLEKQLAEDKKTNAKIKQDLEDQLKKLKDSQGDGRGQNFMAFFINWPSKDHDVDLVIQDPGGRVYDFKRRKHDGQAGLFALDTRRGPGVELWQSKEIIPGKYKATYSLYNDYGNTEPAPVSAVILTPRGSFEIPIANLSSTGQRKATVVFDVDSAGKVKLQGSK